MHSTTFGSFSMTGTRLYASCMAGWILSVWEDSDGEEQHGLEEGKAEYVGERLGWL